MHILTGYMYSSVEELINYNKIDNSGAFRIVLLSRFQFLKTKNKSNVLTKHFLKSLFNFKILILEIFSFNHMITKYGD